MVESFLIDFNLGYLQDFFRTWNRFTNTINIFPFESDFAKKFYDPLLSWTSISKQNSPHFSALLQSKKIKFRE